MSRSIHLRVLPDLSGIPDEAKLVSAMDTVRDVCSAGLSVRSNENIRTRQPLASATIYGEKATMLEPYKDLVADELNVKEVVLSESLTVVASHKLQLNFPVLGKRLPDKMKQLIPASKKGEWKLDDAGKLEILGETLLEEEYSLKLEAINKNGACATQAQDMLVVLDLSLTPELLQEGLARDVVRLVQQDRKEANLHISDRINLAISAANDIQEAIAKNAAFIKEQTLAATLEVETASALTHQFSHEIDGKPVAIAFSTAA